MQWPCLNANQRNSDHEKSFLVVQFKYSNELKLVDDNDSGVCCSQVVFHINFMSMIVDL